MISWWPSNDRNACLQRWQLHAIPRAQYRSVILQFLNDWKLHHHLSSSIIILSSNRGENLQCSESRHESRHESPHESPNLDNHGSVYNAIWNHETTRPTRRWSHIQKERPSVERGTGWNDAESCICAPIRISATCPPILWSITSLAQLCLIIKRLGGYFHPCQGYCHSRDRENVELIHYSWYITW